MPNLSAARQRRIQARQSRSHSSSLQGLSLLHESELETTTDEEIDTIIATRRDSQTVREKSAWYENGEKKFHTVAITLPYPVRPQTPMSHSLRPVRLLIASLGNPPPYHSTRHSAGHILLKSFASYLHLSSPSRDKSYPGGNVALGSDVGLPEYTLWQSSSLMNISGVGLLKAWKTFLSLQQSQAEENAVTGLVLLHDELEIPLAQLKTRRGEGSAKGHNGIKSVQASLQGAGMLSGLGDRFIKIGVGIGRPLSRERDEVSAYVLGQLAGTEKARIEDAAGKLDEVLQRELGRLSKL